MTRTVTGPPLEFRTIEDVVEAVRSTGGRLSVPRRMVLEALFAAEGPVSAETIAGELRLELTSVYRNLEHLEALGVARHVHLGHGPGLYALRGRGRARLPRLRGLRSRHHRRPGAPGRRARGDSGRVRLRRRLRPLPHPRPVR